VQSPNEQLYIISFLACTYVYFNINLQFINEISLDESCNNNVKTANLILSLRSCAHRRYRQYYTLIYYTRPEDDPIKWVETCSRFIITIK